MKEINIKIIILKNSFNKIQPIPHQSGSFFYLDQRPGGVLYISIIINKISNIVWGLFSSSGSGLQLQGAD
jgi:hypothetical protein